MNILDAIKRLLPSFGRKDVREKIRVISSKLMEIVIPMLAMYSEGLKDKELKSSFGKVFIAKLLQFLPSNVGSGNAPYVKVLTACNANLVKLLDQLSDYVGKHMLDQIHIEGITYQKATVLRLIELADFFVDYTSRHLQVLVAYETDMTAFGKGDLPSTTKAERNYLLDNRNAYFQLIELFYEDPKTILAKVMNIPEVLVVDTEVGDVPALTGGAADPLQLGIIPGVSRVFHWIGIRKVDWEIERYERAKKEKRSIELRLEALRQKMAGMVDARTEAIIDGYERELIMVRDNISRMEANAQ